MELQKQLSEFCIATLVENGQQIDPLCRSTIRRGWHQTFGLRKSALFRGPDTQGDNPRSWIAIIIKVHGLYSSIALRKTLGAEVHYHLTSR